MAKRSSKRKKIGASILAGALVVSTVAFYIPTQTAVNADSEKTLNEQFPELLKSAQTGDKSETVYAVLDSNGKTEEVTISEWLQNDSKADTLKDYSVLKDIKNTSGDEEYGQDGNDLVWQANGNDIKYSGTYDGDLPVNVKITYYLDGDKVSAKDIAGKEGDVTIRFDYDVDDSVSEDGYDLVRPYVLLSAVVLDNDDFTNVTVNNGKAINDGDNTAVVGIALPGMLEDLDLSSDDIDIPDHVTVRAHTTDFHIDGTYTVADSGFLNDTDTSKIDDAKSDVDELMDGLDELSDASEKLVDGSSKLADGADTLATSTESLEEGAEDLKDGTSQLKTGSAALASGTALLSSQTPALVSGIGQISDGADEAKSSADTLSSSTDNIYTAAQQIADGATQLNTGAQNLVSAMGTTRDSANEISTKAGELSIGVSELKTGINTLASSMTSAASSISSNLNSVGGKTYSSPSSDDVDKALQKAYEAAAGNDEAQAKIREAQDALSTYKGAVDRVTSDATADSAADQTNTETAKGLAESLNSETTQKEVKDLTDGATTAADGASALSEGTAALAAGIGKEGDTTADTLSGGVNLLAAGASNLNIGVNGVKDEQGEYTQMGLMQYLYQLNNGTSVFASELAELQTGANRLKSNTSTLTDDTKNLNDGAQQLNSGIIQVDTGAGTIVKYMGMLADGTNELSDGADTLADGMAQFNEDGIQKLVSEVDDADLEGMLNRVQATINAASDGSFVGGKLEDQTGESKIIFKTGEIESDSDK